MSFILSKINIQSSKWLKWLLVLLSLHCLCLQCLAACLVADIKFPLQGKRKASTSAFQSNPLPLSHLPSIPPSFRLWSLQLEQIRAKWSYRVSPPLTTVYRRAGAEQPFNNAEWILLLGSATFPTFLPRFATRRKTQGKEGKNDGHFVANNSWRGDDKLRGKIKTIYGKQ